MRFKIKSTEFKISFSFFAILLLSMLSDTSAIYFYSLLASLIHELIHIVFIYLLHSGITGIYLTLFGGKIVRKNSGGISNFKESIISLSAPSVNIIIGILSFIINRESLWGKVNLCIGIFNILPFFAFDGGRGLFYLMMIKLSERTTNIILNITSMLVTAVFSFVCIHLFINHNNNFLMLALSLYMIFSIIINSRNINTNCNSY